MFLADPLNKYSQFIFASIIQIYVGIEFYRFSLTALKNRIADMNLLVSIGTLSAYLYSVFVIFFGNLLPENVRHVYFEASGSVITFVLLGRYLETKAKFKASDFMKKLLNLKPKKATVLIDGKEYEIDAENIVKGDVIIIKPGDVIPVDGVVLEGQSEVDKSSITGESKLEFVKVGDTVISGSINQIGVIKIKAVKNAKESVINQIIDLLLQAQSRKPQIGKFADRVTQFFVPIVLMFAILTFDVWYILFNSLEYAFVNMVAVLVIACPCALGLATPIAIVNIVGRGAKEGILFKNPEIVEKIAKIDIAVFDKTGTLTTGKMEVKESLIINDKFLSYIYSLEKDINHPISKAIVKFLGDLKDEKLEYKTVIAGEGVVGKFGEKTIIVGNSKILERYNIKMSKEVKDFYSVHTKDTVVFAAVDNEIVAVMSISDSLRQEAREVIEYLKKRGIKPVMLTGDNQAVAREIASLLNIDEYRANLTPLDKYNEIIKFKNQGKSVIFIGDGINDAPAMSVSDIGIAVESSTDIAKESGDIILMNTDLRGVIKALNLSVIGLKVIKQNLFWAYIYNIIGIPLAAGLFYPIFGILLNPVYAGIAMSISSVSVVLNSLRIRLINIDK
ncbi:MAG: copper-translocating P-type ATPase [Hydrogenothermaceae bacterium]